MPVRPDRRLFSAPVGANATARWAAVAGRVRRKLATGLRAEAVPAAVISGGVPGMTEVGGAVRA